MKLTVIFSIKFGAELMKKSVLTVMALALLTSPALAQTPPEVLKPYKAYMAAFEKGDTKTASDEGYQAWRMAEKYLGDVKTTGDLAINYAEAGAKVGGKKVADAFKRSIDLAALYKEGAAETRLAREIKYAQYSLNIRRFSGLKKRLEKSIDFAEANGLGTSTYSGELYTMLAQIEVNMGDHDETEKYADKALEIFETRKDDIITPYPYVATLYSGYGKEGNDEFIPALMQYQKIMENTESGLPRDHPFVMRALGRWMSMRDKVKREGLTEQAEAAGMCECWPYDKKRNETVQPIERVPPIMPKYAEQSGFSIVEFDLADDGRVLNPRILESWPKDVFEDSSMTALKKWKYTPRSADETDADRKDIVSTFRYFLTDRSGNLIE